MIPVTMAPEPATFKGKVRRKGADAIAELVGKLPAQSRPGPKRRRVAARRDEIPSDAFPPYWRDVLPEMLEAYGNLCAYLAMYLEPATGSPSVDHFVPRSKSWRLVYEWSNYRLAASLINSAKSDRELVLDPFSIRPGMFALEFVGLQVIPGPAALGPSRDDVDATIDLLGLNLLECCKQRREYVASYKDGVPLRYIERRAPFIAQELRRQGLLVRGDD